MADTVLYEEKQYLGNNKFSIIRRSVLALTCFLLYYWSENPKPIVLGSLQLGPYPAEHIAGSGQMFFLLGVCVLILSIILVFILHLHTLITPESIKLRGFSTSRKVEILFSEIEHVRKVRFKETLMNRPSYHHYSKGKIRFYCRGSEAVELSRKDGLIYRIGSQRADELLRVLKDCLANNKA
jgi:hypothetical protein